MNNEYNHAFQLPDSILTQMEEMSGGAYMIFIIGSDGMPAIYESFDSLPQEMQIKSFAHTWLDAEREYRKEKIKKEIEYIYGSNNLNEDEEDEDDE
jgi:hypothetical protein